MRLPITAATTVSMRLGAVSMFLARVSMLRDEQCLDVRPLVARLGEQVESVLPMAT